MSQSSVLGQLADRNKPALLTVSDENQSSFLLALIQIEDFISFLDVDLA
jgi:hypothetical protein